MGNPRTTAIASAMAAAVIAFTMLFENEGVSPTLATVQWVLLVLALIGLVGSIVQMSRK